MQETPVHSVSQDPPRFVAWVGGAVLALGLLLVWAGFSVAHAYVSGEGFDLQERGELLGTLPAGWSACDTLTTAAASYQYAPPWLWSRGRAAAVAYCSDAGAVRMAFGALQDSAVPLVAVYKTFYQWDAATRRWISRTLTAATPADATDKWIKNVGKASFTRIPSNQTTYVAFYVCEYVNGAWNCGCKDATCATRNWNLQVLKPTGGSTAYSYPGHTGYTQSNGGTQGSGTNNTNATAGGKGGKKLPGFSARVQFPLRGLPDKPPGNLEPELKGDWNVNLRSYFIPAEIGGRKKALVGLARTRVIRAFDLLSGKLLWQDENTSGTADYKPSPTVVTWKLSSVSAMDVDGDGVDELAHCWIVNGDQRLVIRDSRTGAIKGSVSLPRRGKGDVWVDLAAGSGKPCRAFFVWFEGEPSPHVLLNGQKKNPSGAAKFTFHPANWGIVMAYQLRGFTPVLDWIQETPLAGHHIAVQDENFDGKADAVWVGKYRLTANGAISAKFDQGSSVWIVNKYPSHADSLSVTDVTPANPGLEIVAVGEGRGGVYDATTGRRIFHFPAKTTKNPQHIAVGDFRPELRGREIWVRQKHGGAELFSSQGKLLASSKGIGAILQTVPDLDGDSADDLLMLGGDVLSGRSGTPLMSLSAWHPSGKRPRGVHQFYYYQPAPFSVDLWGDRREEIVAWGRSTLAIGSFQDKSATAQYHPPYYWQRIKTVRATERGVSYYRR